jgi:DNA-binding response OmpR family regulator/heme-degrading monooxygenase HmoA
VIIRVFRGQVQPGMADEFARVLDEQAIPRFNSLPGIIAVNIGRPTDSNPDEFLVTTVWRDIESLKEFAGDRWYEAKITPEERPLLRQTFVHHYEENDEYLPPAPSRARPGAQILLAGSPTFDLPGVVAALRERGLATLIVTSVEGAIRLVSRWRPPAAVVAADLPDVEGLLRHLERKSIPIVLVGGERQLRLPERIGNIEAGILAPAQPSEIAAAIEIVVGQMPLSDLPERIDVGAVRLDVGGRVAVIDGSPIELPPKEFAVLVELALHPGEPVPSSELARRAWPESAWTTGEDVRRTVYRLRRLIGDHRRAEPLIRNRRGFGYVLSTR